MTERVIEPGTDKPKGERFTKVYEAGWNRVEKLFDMPGGPTAGKLWVFLAKHASHHNALVVSIRTLASVLGKSERSVHRATAALEEAGALVVAKLGTANCYILNPSEVWKSAEDHKRFCGFSTRTIVGFEENAGLRARLTHFLAQAEEAERAAAAAAAASSDAGPPGSALIYDERQPSLVE